MALSGVVVRPLFTQKKANSAASLKETDQIFGLYVGNTKRKPRHRFLKVGFRNI